jgi:hypothetical protein
VQPVGNTVEAMARAARNGAPLKNVRRALRALENRHTLNTTPPA